MRFSFLVSLVSTLIAYSSISAQGYPDYKERSFVFSKDTLEAINPSFAGSEGIVDAEKYILGPGDVLLISVSGLQEKTFKIPIDHEGNLYIPEVGGIELKDNNLKIAREKLINQINRYYKDVDIFVTLSDFKKIKVSLIGDVVKPSNFILPGNARLLDLITVSGGLNPTANYRNIRIIKRDSSESLYDLLSFMRYGKIDENPFLQGGDIVAVDRVDQVVAISGLIKYPGSYEFREGETVKDLITIAGGLLSKAKKDSIEVISFDPSGKYQLSTYYDLKTINEREIVLKSQDHIVVRQIPEFMIDRFITVDGYVRYPGYYKIVKDKTTLNDIIKESGGFTEEASLTDATLTRFSGNDTPDPELERLKLMDRSEMTDDEYDYLKAKSRERKGKVVVDFVQLFEKNNMMEDVILINGDQINIPKKKNYVTLLGQVVKPGNIIYSPNYNYEDYIKMAGGYGWRALDDEVRIIKANTGEWLYAEDVETIEPGDAIWVPEDPPGAKFWDVFTTSLTVLGQLAAVVAAVAAVIIATE